MNTQTKTEKETCLKCGSDFEDKNYNPELPLAKRIYCNKCIDEMSKEVLK